jgi:hypothetical protein
MQTTTIAPTLDKQDFVLDKFLNLRINLMKKTHNLTLLHNDVNVKHSLVDCYEKGLPTCTLCNYSKAVIRNVVEQDDKILIGCRHKFKQNKKRYDLKSISHTEMELQMPPKKGFTNKPDSQQRKGGKLNTHSHLKEKTWKIHKFLVGIA